MNSKHHFSLIALWALVGCHTDSEKPGELDAGDRDAAQASADAGSDAAVFELEPLKSDVERDTTPDVSAAELAQLGEGNATAALSLFRTLHKEGQNIVFSPHSISTAFAMAYAGANGDTKTQIASTLHFTLPEAKLHAGFNALDLALASRNLPADEDHSALTWEAVNALWTSSMTLEPSYLDILAANYGTGVYSVDVGTPAGTDIVNRAVEAWTHGRIKKFLDPNPDAKFILTNTVYLNAPWDTPFEKESTTKRPFELASGQVEVDTMVGDVHVQATSVDGVEVVSIPYRGDKLELTILMPPREGYSDFVATLDAARFAALIAQEEPVRANLYLPKFEIALKTSLKELLLGLGMVDAFEGGKADFSLMANPYYQILDVIHAANIEVTEPGTEAAAATAIIFGDDGDPGPDTTIEINRAFVFAVRDVPTGALLFLGTFEKP